MAEFQEVMRQRNRMCRQYTYCSNGCILAGLLEDSGTANCMEYAKAYPAKFESAVMKWAKENPAKTFMKVLLDAFPTMDTDVVYAHLCPGHIIPAWPLAPVGCLRDEEDTQECEKCWALPVPEKN